MSCGVKARFERGITLAYDIRDKVVLVTGANRGIGRALAEGLIDHGVASVYAAVRNKESAAPLVQKYGEKIVPLRLDLEDPGSIADAAGIATDAEVVISNAGVLTRTSALDEDAVRSLEYEMRVNVLGLIRMAQAFAPILKANGGGVLVQLNSVASMMCIPDFATYCASKAAAYSITLGLRQQLQAQGTRVLSVHPGPIATDMADTAGIAEIAEPPSLVTEAVLAALEDEDFHVYPDTMARQIGAAYQGFAENVIEGSPVKG
jgi:NAD(P)-dependent dehydrogenase (short-subunit alcohol dehydrogenase family)